jgi:hypothetical protein
VTKCVEHSWRDQRRFRKCAFEILTIHHERKIVASNEIKHSSETIVDDLAKQRKPRTFLKEMLGHWGRWVLGSLFLIDAGLILSGIGRSR